MCDNIKHKHVWIHYLHSTAGTLFKFCGLGIIRENLKINYPQILLALLLHYLKGS